MGFLRSNKKGLLGHGKDPAGGRSGRSGWVIPLSIGIVLGMIVYMTVLAKFPVSSGPSKGGPGPETGARRSMRRSGDEGEVVDLEEKGCDLLGVCKEQGATCGTIDACGTKLSCGGCTFPETCGGLGFPNQCGCTPVTCSALERSCGFAPDGCGGVMRCGKTCPPRELPSLVSAGPPPQRPYRVAYFANWAQFNPGDRAYLPEDIAHEHISHAIFAYGYLEKDSHLIKTSMYNDDDDANSHDKGMWSRFAESCRQGGSIPMISVGGWDFSFNKGGKDIFTAIVKTAASRKEFIEHAIEFIGKYGFQGFDWWWEFPPASEAPKYVLLLKEMRAALKALEAEKGVKYWQSVLVPGIPGPADTHFPDKSILAAVVDWISVKTYELHAWSDIPGYEERNAVAHAPLFNPEGGLSVSSALEHWEKGGVPKEKLMLGLSLEAFTWTLMSREDHSYGAPAKGSGSAENGGAKVIIADFLETLKGSNARHDILHGPTLSVYGYSGDQWGSYDDERTAVSKAEFVVQQGYGGLFIWSIDMDHKHQLAKAIAQRLMVRVLSGEQVGVDVPKNKLGETGLAVTSAPEKVNMIIASSYVKECPNVRGDHLLAKSLKNKVDYASRHGMSILYNLAIIDTGYDGMWSKQPLFKKLLVAHPEVEWFMWIDSDAFITDMKWDIPWDKYEGYNMVVPGYKRCVFNETRPDWCCLNAGIFLLRRCEWSLKFMDAWLEFGVPAKKWVYSKLFSAELSGRDGLASDDQSALFYLIRKEYEKFGKYIYLEQSYDLHGYWVGIVDKYEKVLEHAGPEYTWSEKHKPSFITHYVGCKMCSNGKGASYPQADCFNNMERSFNFADNQMLLQYGLRHVNLSSPILEKIAPFTFQ